jgi:mRNA-degrading endonuclease RelE of RelBE toxin-antitoxin system
MVKKLPVLVRSKLIAKLELLQENPYHSLLHTKPLTGQLFGFHSFRITREWRVIFQFLDPETIELIKVSHRKDIYKRKA